MDNLVTAAQLERRGMAAIEQGLRHGRRTPDALQAASCLQLGEAHVMLTGDAALRRVAGLNVLRAGA